MQIWAESGKSALPICNYSQILYQFLTFTQNLKRSHKKVKYFFKKLNSHPSFPFCKRVSHFESDLQILYPTFHFCNDFPVFFLAFMI